MRELTATFAGGKLHVILGGNGAGKTTLLRMMAGLAQPTSGTIEVLNGQAPRSAASDIGYMGHASLLYDDLSGLENLEYFASLYPDVSREACSHAMRNVGLEPALARRVGAYSQGMRQRLSLARATVNAPRLLLLDEPFSNVDAASARDIVRLLAGWRDAGVTIIVVTHQSTLLTDVADGSLAMSDGRVVRQGQALEAAHGLDPRELATAGARR